MLFYITVLCYHLRCSCVAEQAEEKEIGVTAVELSIAAAATIAGHAPRITASVIADDDGNA